MRIAARANADIGNVAQRNCTACGIDQTQLDIGLADIEHGQRIGQAALLNEAALEHHHKNKDAMMAAHTLKQAFCNDVGPILAIARMRAGGAINPLARYRASGYRDHKHAERLLVASASQRCSGIV